MTIEAGPYDEEVIAMVLHELRTPLGAMRSAFALWPANTGSPEAIAARQLFGRQLGKALQLLEDLLDMSRLTHEGAISDAEPIELTELVHAEAAEFEDRHRTRRMVLTLDLPSVPLWVRGRRLRLGQIVANLLDNSAKYSPLGGWIAVHLRRDSRSAVLSIQDGGAGIHSEDLVRIFDPFFRGTAPAGQRRDGLGLGLALVKRLVKRHGGTVEARSAGEHCGSEFTVRLPLIES